MKESLRERNQIMKPFANIAVTVFLFMGVIHLLRLFFGWKVILNGMILPVWISTPGFFLASGLAFMLWQEARYKR
jgi:hypothetical protein